MVSWWATPGATTLRPPDHPAMKCGSTRPVAMRTSASTKRRSSLTGVPRVVVRPRSTWSASLRASWFTMRTRSMTHGSPTTSASSSPTFGRCRPVATRMMMRAERNARADQRFDHRAQEEVVGHRPRDVANEDAGALASPGEVGQRRRGDRLQQCMANGGCWISDFFQLALGDQGDVRIGGHVQLKLSAAVQKADRFRD